MHHPSIVAREDELSTCLIHKDALLDADEGTHIMLGWRLPGTTTSCVMAGHTLEGLQ